MRCHSSNSCKAGGAVGRVIPDCHASGNGLWRRRRIVLGHVHGSLRDDDLVIPRNLGGVRGETARPWV